MRENTTIFIGNATEPELRFTPSGVALCKFALSLYEGKNEDGTYKDSSWVDIIVWQEMAERVAESVKKGDRIGVLGRIKQNRWENENGEKRSKLECVADEVMISLKWDNATSQKAPRSDGGTRPAPKAATPSADPFGPDEAPF